MANLKDTIKITPELKAIAEEIKTLTALYAPVDTGNLRNKIKSFNEIGNMIKFDKTGKASITIDYAPPGAEYGEFWDEPSTDKSKTRHKIGRAHV